MFVSIHPHQSRLQWLVYLLLALLAILLLANTAFAQGRRWLGRANLESRAELLAGIEHAQARVDARGL